MPKSRNRRTKNRSDATRRSDRVRRYQETERLRANSSAGELAGRMTPKDWANLRACADAEARGDAAEALRLYSTIPAFDESWHRQRLELIAELGDDAPGWVWSRWMTLQARRPLWSDADGDKGPDPVLSRAVEIAYPHGIDPSRMQGLSMDVFVSFLYERDWVLRQLIVYEEGGLRDLVQGRASEALLARADYPREWADAPMGGYRLDSDGDDELQVTDLGTGEVINLLDLGLAFQHEPGQHFLGRVVPTSTAPGLMFEWRPLPVGRVTAACVAAEPERWLEIVAERARSEALPCGFSLFDDDTDMLTDLPAHPWLRVLERDDIQKLPWEDGLISYDSVALHALGRLLRGFGKFGFVVPSLRPVLWAMLLQPGMDEAIRARFTGREHARGWRVIANAVAEPAAARCRTYAQLGLATAS